MTTDITRFEANERVDLADFLFLADTSLRSQSRHWADQFFRDPTRDGPSWILGGFGITYLGAQLTVTKGRAILGHREIGDVYYGSLATEGPVERVVDVTTFAAGSYGVYIRFELVDGENASRAFWDPTGDGAEFAQTIATRRLANWSVRVELLTSGSPGAEWFKIGEATISGGAVTGVTNQRDFYFEGEEHNSYASQWSSDGGGDANDRDADRATYGVKSLHTFTAAMRQCLEDIKGRGLRRWWSRDIGGMNIGFDADPVEDRLAVGDANFYLDWQDSNNVYLYWGANDYFKYDRVTPQLQGWIDSTLSFRGDATGIRARGIAVRDNTGDAPVINQISCGFSNFRMEYDAGDTYLRFDGTQTYLHWDDSAEELICKVANGTPWKALINGVLMRGLVIDNSLGLSMETNAIKIGNDNFKLDWDGTDPYIYLDNGDYLHYDRSAVTDGQLNLQIGTAAFHINKDDAVLPLKVGSDNTANYTEFVANTSWSLYVNSILQLKYTDTDGLNINEGLVVGSPSITPQVGEIYATGLIHTGSNITSVGYMSPGTYLSTPIGQFGTGITAGYYGTPESDAVHVGDVNFKLKRTSSTYAMLQWDTDDYLGFDRDAPNTLEFYLGGTLYHFWREDSARIVGAPSSPQTRMADPGEYTYAQNTATWCIRGKTNTGNANEYETKALSSVIKRATGNYSGSGQQSLYDLILMPNNTNNKVYHIACSGQCYRDSTVEDISFQVRVGSESSTTIVAQVGFFPSTSVGITTYWMDVWLWFSLGGTSGSCSHWANKGWTDNPGIQVDEHSFSRGSVSSIDQEDYVKISFEAYSNPVGTRNGNIRLVVEEMYGVI